MSLQLEADIIAEANSMTFLCWNKRHVVAKAIELKRRISKLNESNQSDPDSTEETKAEQQEEFEGAMQELSDTVHQTRELDMEQSIHRGILRREAFDLDWHHSLMDDLESEAKMRRSVRELNVIIKRYRKKNGSLLERYPSLDPFLVGTFCGAVIVGAGELFYYILTR